MGVKGWEFLIVDPFKKDIQQKSQEEYTKYYKLSYNKFIQELCIPTPDDLFEKNNLFTFYILCDENNDKIEIENENCKMVFLRSVFLKIKYKTIKTDLELYYNKFDITVRNLYISSNYIFLIIEKKNNNYQ